MQTLSDDGLTAVVWNDDPPRTLAPLPERNRLTHNEPVRTGGLRLSRS